MSSRADTVDTGVATAARGNPGRPRSRASRNLRPLLSVLPLVAFLAAVYFLPVGRLLLLSVTEPAPTLDNYRKLLDNAVYLRVFANTLRTAMLVTLVTLVLAYPTAYYLSVVPRRTANLLMFFVLVPFWTSILVRSYAWMVLLGNQGVVNDALLKLGIIGEPLRLMYTSGAVAIGMIHILLPFMILPLFGAMRGIDRSLLDAAAGLGAKPWNVFLRVFLPLSLPGVVAGCSIVFVFSLGFYITPALLGGRRDLTVAMLIAQQFNAVLDWGFGAALSVVLLVLTVAIMVVFNRLASADRVYGRAA